MVTTTEPCCIYHNGILHTTQWIHWKNQWWYLRCVRFGISPEGPPVTHRLPTTTTYSLHALHAYPGSGSHLGNRPDWWSFWTKPYTPQVPPEVLPVDLLSSMKYTDVVYHFHSQEWSSSNFSCSLTSHITSHSTKNLAFHSLLRLKDDSCTSSHYLTYTFLLKKLGECTFWAWDWKGYTNAVGSELVTTTAPCSLPVVLQFSMRRTGGAATECGRSLGELDRVEWLFENLWGRGIILASTLQQPKVGRTWCSPCAVYPPILTRLTVFGVSSYHEQSSRKTSSYTRRGLCLSPRVNLLLAVPLGTRSRWPQTGPVIGG